jgi:FAD:protein FMN transferase
MARSNFILLCLTLLLAGCNGKTSPSGKKAPGADKSPGVHTETRFVFGPVTASIKVVEKDKDRATRAIDNAFAAIAQANNLFSTYVAKSEVSQLNAAGGKPCHVSSQTLAVLKRSVEVAELSGGAFDVTAGPLIKLWKRSIKSGALPADAELAAARKLVGYKQLVLDADGPCARLGAGMSVDLGGIAKGFAVDRAVDALRAAGVRSGIVDAGGDGYAMGTRPGGTPWRVGIQNPRAVPGDRLPQVLLLTDQAYATSGDYEQYTEIGGVRYSHIVDPRTGRPARAAASVTIVAPDCTTADALATAVSVLGPKDGIALVEKLKNVECLIITEGAGGIEAKASSGFRALTAD